MGDGKKAMKSQSVVRQSSQDLNDELATVLAFIAVVKRAEATVMVKFRIVKIQDKI